MSIGRTWKLWAYRYENGRHWHIGEKRWVALHQLPHPLVAVLVEEICGGDLFMPQITHYGWQYAEGSRYRHGDTPTMIQIRTGNDPENPRRALMFLDMCFPYGVKASVDSGEGTIVPLRITERTEDA